ncbi:DNA polymerase/3'-5' exonuclease PolX [Actinoalloteichus caeruleus]|uniref:DNA polymerase/3'-5' exonuclease PolX n=1 Tax=Actinoalloteichus cyanogriseus TaxID=2893586 RepID=UPI0004C22391|nr:DNA polymerase/3'-5' exonuclease PolX [Actinoalloteichus caeruleus]
MPRSNEAVADMLTEFAELLAISGADPFKIRAYERAARSVRGHTADLTGLDRRGLRAIPGVGDQLATKIKQYLDTGTVTELDTLRAEVPAGLRALLAVPGLGPRRAHQVFQERGITSTAALRDALRHGHLRDLRGWGPRTEENLTAALRETQRAGHRIPLALALDLADQALGQLTALPGAQRAEVAGSVRRRRDTVGDLDLLVATTDPDAVMRAVTTLPAVDRVLGSGGTKTSVRTRDGIQIDVRAVPPRAWGAALLYFTGSQAHNIRIREIAVHAGLTLSEYGLLRARTRRPVRADSEEELYARLGLDWIPPPLREDTGEIQAAQRHQLPRLLRRRDLRGDLHTHTDLTDGVASLEEMVRAARAAGHEYCAITDHAPLLRMQRMTTEKALEQRRRIRRLDRDAGIHLLHGTELNIQPDGGLDWDDDILRSFDIRVASVHSHFRQSRHDTTARLLAAVRHPLVNVLGHPTTRLIGHRPALDADWDAVFAEAARHDTALEINSFPDRMDLDGDLARRARDFGVRFSVASDAHAATHLDQVRLGVGTAQRGWVGPDEVINTYPWQRLRQFLTPHPRRAP